MKKGIFSYQLIAYNLYLCHQMAIHDFSFIKRFDRQEVFNQSNTSYTWPANKDGYTIYNKIKDATRAACEEKGLQVEKELNCYV